MSRIGAPVLLCAVFISTLPAAAARVLVTNERSGDVTVIDADSNQVIATIPVGKRPRGIRVSPDGKRAYVAVSGTPISGPPESRGRSPTTAPATAAVADPSGDG